MTEPTLARPRRLFLHVGLPKSGTTSMQEAMRHHRDALATAGLCYPKLRKGAMFHAALEMTGKASRWGLDDEFVAGTFDALLDVGRRSGGDVVISHEVFGQARPEQVPEIVRRASDFELHVIITARDMARTLTAAWQEKVKNGYRGTFDDFVELKAGTLPGGARSEEVPIFWRLQNLGEVLDRWSPVVPPERIHLVPVPRRGAAPDELWRRFASAMDLDPAVFDYDEVPRTNESLGAGKVEFLREVNVALDGRLEEPWGASVRKHWFAQSLLSPTGGRRAQAPAAAVERFADECRGWLKKVTELGVQVHGDLDDLDPRVDAAQDAPHPDDVTEAEQLDGLPTVVAEMLLRVRDLEAELQQARRRLDQQRVLPVPEPVEEALPKLARRARRLAGRIRPSSS